jgi:hypothetical protein
LGVDLGELINLKILNSSVDLRMVSKADVYLVKLYW